MANHLRSIALTVNEPTPGLFHWALLDSDADKMVFDHRFMMADEPYDSFEKAARAGLLNWLKLAGDDTKRGPRIEVKRTPLVPAPGPWTTLAKTQPQTKAPAKPKTRRETSLA